MNRLEFMQRLEQLLSDISPKEKEEALQYYNDYLNDAGVENEQEALDSLGSPEKVAKLIKQGLDDGSFYGEFTENGFEDPVTAEEKKEVGASNRRAAGKDTGHKNGGYQGSPWRSAYEKKENTGESKKLSGGMIALIVIVCILASPIWVSAAAAVIGAVFGIIFGVLGGLVGVAAAAVGLTVAAVLLVGFGIGELFVSPLIGICLIGTGLLLGGFAMLFLLLTVWLCGTAIPWLFRNAADLCGRLFHKKGGKEA